jgi:hypothetical protein
MTMRAIASVLTTALAVVAIPLAAPVFDPPEELLIVPTDTAIEILMDDLNALRAEAAGLRNELALAKLSAKQTHRELEELRQFVHDHDRYGDDFERYTEIRSIADREARRRTAEMSRQRRDAERSERLARLDTNKRDRDQERAVEDRESRYRRAGFASLGLDTYLGKMAFSYASRRRSEVAVDYDPFIGLYYRPGLQRDELNFSEMTISGSVLNASPEVRNIGVAITFFDENGNQVGAEIVQIDNARTDVPYPFTSKIDMALNRVFASSTQYVLYADVAGEVTAP